MNKSAPKRTNLREKQMDGARKGGNEKKVAQQGGQCVELKEPRRNSEKE